MAETSTLLVGLELLSLLDHLLPATPTTLLLPTPIFPVQVYLFQEQLVVLELSQFVSRGGDHGGVGLHVLGDGVSAEEALEQVGETGEEGQDGEDD